MYTRRLVKCPLLFLSVAIKLEFSRQILEKYWNVKFHENQLIGNRVVPCGRTDVQADRQTDRYDQANSDSSQFCEGA